MTIAARATLVPGINALLARLMGVPVKEVNEATAQYKAPARDQRRELLWNIVSVERNGQDGARGEYDPDTQPEGDTYSGPGAPLGSIIYSVTGQRRITFQVTVKSYEWERDADYYAGLVQDRLPLPSARNELRALGLALAKVGPVHDVGNGAAEDGRTVTISAIEFVCNAASWETDSPVTTIAKVNATTTVST